MTIQDDSAVEQEYLGWLRLMAKKRASKLWDAIRRIREEALKDHCEYEDDWESLNRYINVMDILFRRIAKRQRIVPDTVKEIVVDAIDKAIEEVRIDVEKRFKEINAMPVDGLKEMIIGLEKILLYDTDCANLSEAIEALKRRLDID